ncbi:helix-turn-helix transcriptional regulator [Microbacterium sp.]|uniref:PadR family transcriptional regulator n=1 Tax=Microbacterium sp. TaxID=51671 RepID=UPI002810CE1E|nr:helix-turn-helix transcriptional regulator [Microbacterium sp.]
MSISADAIRGYVDLMVLSLLRTDPSYAYELAQRITAISGSDYAIKQTTLYSAVKRLEISGFVSSFAGLSPSGKARTYYRITEAGRTHLDAKVEEWLSTKNVVDRFINGTLEGGTT